MYSGMLLAGVAMQTASGVSDGSDPIDDAAGARLGEGIRIDIPADNVLEQAAGPGSEGERATDQARPDQEQGAHITSRKACSSRSFSSGRPIEARRWFGMP